MTALREHAAAIGSDVTYALRLMAKSWVSSAVVVVTLAIAIGVGATVFSAIEAVLLTPLPYDDPAQLVFIFDRPLDQPAAHGSETSLPNSLDWPQLAQSFSAIGSYANWTPTRTGAAVPQALPGLNAGQFTAIPRTNADFSPKAHIQAIANTAAFHFAMIEQGGSSLYATLGRKVSSDEVLRIMMSIGGDEVAHFVEWMDFSGNAVQPPVAPLTDPDNGLTFPNFNATGDPLLQTNLIFPVQCEFIRPSLPRCAVIRPTAFGQIDAMGAANAFIASGLFIGQPAVFNELLLSMAQQADAASRNV